MAEDRSTRPRNLMGEDTPAPPVTDAAEPANLMADQASSAGRSKPRNLMQSKGSTAGGDKPKNLIPAPEDREPTTVREGMVESTQPLHLMPTQQEDALKRAYEWVKENYGQDVAHRMTRPHAFADDQIGDLPVEEIFQGLAPVLGEDLDAIAGMEEYRRNWVENGGNPEELSWNYLRSMSLFMAEEMGTTAYQAAVKASELNDEYRTWKQDLVEGIANDAVESGFMNVIHGLDFFTYLVKKAKILAVRDPEKRAELEQRLLPNIVTEDGTEFRVASIEGIKNIGQRAWADANSLGGRFTEFLGNVTGSETLQDLGRRSQARGDRIQEETDKKTREIQALMGEHVTWWQVGEIIDPLGTAKLIQGLAPVGIPPEEWERALEQVSDQENLDPMFAMLDSQGVRGDIAMAMTVGWDTGVELIADPAVWTGVAAAKVAPAARGVIALAAPGKHAKITSGIARATERAEHAADAVRAAENWVKRLEARNARTAARRGGTISGKDAKETVQAYRALANEKAWLSTFRDPGETSGIIVRNPRNNPKSPNVRLRDTEEYVDRTDVPAGVTTPEQTAREIKQAQAKIRGLQQAMKETPSARNVPGYDDLMEELETAVRNWDETSRMEVGIQARGTQNVISETDRARRLVKIRQRMNNIKKQMDEMGDVREVNPAWTKLEQRMDDAIEFLVAGRTREGLTIEHGPAAMQSGRREVGRPIDEIAKELHDERVKALGRDSDWILPRVDGAKYAQDSPLLELDVRRVLGADDTEQAGDALNTVVRSGGVGIEDVWLHQPMPLHNVTPEVQPGLVNWRALDEVNDVTKTERQMEQGAQFDLGYSTRRSLHRQLDIAKRNYGLARKNKRTDKVKVIDYEATARARSRNPDAPTVWKETTVIKQREAEVKAIKEQIRKVGKTKDEFDDAWLPQTRKSVDADPETFHQRMGTFGDRLLETAYPGGWGVRALQQSRVGQFFMPMREPQRFYETFSPRTWERIQGGYLRYEHKLQAWNEGLRRGAVKAGIFKERANYNPKKWFKKYDVDEEQNTLLFDLLDADRNSDTWARLAAKAKPELLEFHDDIRRQMDHMADLQGIGRGEGAPRYLRGYMRHSVTRDQFTNGARPIEYIGVPRDAEMFVSHLMERGGAGNYDRNALAVLDMYGRATLRKIEIEPLFDDILATGKKLEQEYQNPMMLQYANDLVAELQGKPTPFMARVDQFMGWAHNKMVPSVGKIDTRTGKPTTEALPKAAQGRKALMFGGRHWQPGRVDRALTGITGLMWAGTLPGNPRYPLMQIGTGLLTTGSRFGLWRTTKGVWTQATREGQAMTKAAGVHKEFDNIFESSAMRNYSKAMAEKVPVVSPMGVMTTHQTEEFIRGTTFHAAVDMYLTKFGFSSWDEAVEAGFNRRIAYEAMRASQEVNHMFGAIGRSPMLTRHLFGSKGVAASTTQFLSFMPKQTEELLSQFNENPGRVMQYFMLSGSAARLAAQHTGIDITNYVGFGYLPENPQEDIRSPLFDTLIETINMASAASKNDRLGVRFHGERVLDGVDNMVPLMVGWDAFTKSAKRLSTGQDISRSGALNRELSFGDFAQDPSLRGLAEELGPRGLHDQDAPMGALGGDLLPTLFGQQNISDRIQRRAMVQAEKAVDKYLFTVQRRLDDMLDAIESGDDEKIGELVELLRVENNLYIDPTNVYKRQVELQSLSAQFRFWHERSPKAMKYNIYKHFQENAVQFP